MMVLIVEDEQNAREALRRMIEHWDNSLNIHEVASVSAAVHAFKEYQPSIIFLDIMLDGGNAFDFLNQIDSSSSKIIFTTAYNHHAIRAFKYSAVDYLLKPINPNELKTALFKAKERIAFEKEHHQMWETIQHNLSAEDKKIVVNTLNEKHILNVSEIIRLKAEGAYTQIVTNEKSLLASKNMKHYQDILDEEFIRSHHSHLVNIAHIQGLNKEGNLVLSNQDEVPVSSRKKSEISKLLKTL